MRAHWVSHSHWDREWYRSFEDFRARLIETVDRVLDQVRTDAGFRFLLDGQTIILEDYLELRPQRRKELEEACAAGRIAIGPWYVQPDSLLPSGEAHIRNLLEGRRVGRAIGPVSSCCYTPDSFGHPGQFPQLLQGFGLSSFLYWRGNADEVDTLPSEYRWRAPDGSEVWACLLRRGYFGAHLLPHTVELAADRVQELIEDLAKSALGDSVLVMNGIDHAPPDAHTREVSEAVASRMGQNGRDKNGKARTDTGRTHRTESTGGTGWTVSRGLLEDFVETLPSEGPVFEGELLGGRLANLLPGVWSTRVPLKLRNRACERALGDVAEPWAALAQVAGLPDERPALRGAWRALLANQAHDSIGGCSIDRVHEQMQARYETSLELAQRTTRRVLEQLAGRFLGDALDPAAGMDLAVFNPSPRRRTEIVRFELDAFPAFVSDSRGVTYQPVLAANSSPQGFSLDGVPVRSIPATGDGRFLLTAQSGARDLEFVARDLPAFGWKRFWLEPTAAVEDERDSEPELVLGDRAICIATDGTASVRLGEREFAGLFALEDLGDRGDSYDFDPVRGESVRTDRVRETPEPGEGLQLESLEVERCRHASGIAELRWTRRYLVPEGLEESDGLEASRDERSSETTLQSVEITARLVPGTSRIDFRLRLDNRARDHRLRLLFPTSRPTPHFQAGSTFEVVTRATAPRDGAKWLHPAPATYPQQDWSCVNGLTVVVPGIHEAEVTPEGTLALTILRSVGWLSRADLRSRPGPAGPLLPVPGAQCLGSLELEGSLFAGLDPAAARDATLAPACVGLGAEARLPEDTCMLRLLPSALVLSALKPAEQCEGAMVVRVLNPSDEALRGELVLGFTPRSASLVRLDESPVALDENAGRCELEGRTVGLDVPAHALRTVLLSL